MASCKWSCQGSGRCYKLDDCQHKAQMDKAPQWLLALIDDWYFAKRHVKPPLREKFVYPKEEV